MTDYSRLVKQLRARYQGDPEKELMLWIIVWYEWALDQCCHSEEQILAGECPDKNRTIHGIAVLRTLAGTYV